jgi:hypothetical protein
MTVMRGGFVWVLLGFGLDDRLRCGRMRFSSGWHGKELLVVIRRLTLLVMLVGRLIVRSF